MRRERGRGTPVTPSARIGAGRGPRKRAGSRQRWGEAAELRGCTATEEERAPNGIVAPGIKSGNIRRAAPGVQNGGGQRETAGRARLR